MSTAPKIVTRSKPNRRRNELPDFSFTSDHLPKLTNADLTAYHQSAWDAFQELPFPTLRDEAWRRTDIRGLNTNLFSLGNTTEDSISPPNKYLNPAAAAGDERAGQIVVNAGKISRTMDKALEAQGVIFKDFHSAEIEHPELLSKILGQIVSAGEDKFTALAAALASDGVFLYVPKNVVIDHPLHSLYWGLVRTTP